MPVKQPPLEDRLAEMFALRGRLSLTQAMHALGVAAPKKAAPGQCGHATGEAKDGRCLGCKRDADKRHSKRTAFRQAFALLEERKMIRPAEKTPGVWLYCGPSPKMPSPVKPKLPQAAPVMVQGEIYVAELGPGNRCPDRMCVICRPARYCWRHDRSSCTPCQAYAVRRHDEMRADLQQSSAQQALMTERAELYQAWVTRGRDRGEMPPRDESSGRLIRQNGALCTCLVCNEEATRRVRAEEVVPVVPITDRVYLDGGTTYSMPTFNVPTTMSNSASMQRWNWTESDDEESR